MIKLKHIITTCTSLTAGLIAKAQMVNNNTLAAAERKQESLYIVMAVVITIVIGLFLYLIALDRKISKLEKEKQQYK